MTAAPTAEPAPTGPDAPGSGEGPQRRRRWWLLALVAVLGWFAVGGVAGPYSGKLAEVQRNDASSFLPATAESTRVTDLQAKFADRESFPAFVLLESERALTADQLAAFGAFANRIPSIEIPVEGAAPRTVGEFLVPGPVAVVPSQDGRAALALLNFDAADIGVTLPDETSPIQRAVEQVRAAEGGLETAGTKVYVAGPAGQVADLVEAFGSLDSTLLIVTLLAVLVILLFVYRSPVLPFLVIVTAVLALGLASFVVYWLAKKDVIALDGQGQGILSILVLGAATDYSLLLVSRYREELRRHDDRFDAMRLAWRRTLEPVAASAGTVILGLLCLLLSDLGPTRGLGPVGAIGIAAALVSSLTFLPAVLVIPGRTTGGEHGRWVFWPGVPHVGSVGSETRGLWARVARTVGTHPRRVWALTALVLFALAAWVPTLRAEGTKQADVFLTTVESVTGGEALGRHFPGGSGNPTVVVAPADRADAVIAAVRGTDGVASVLATTDAPAGAAPVAGAAPKVVDGLVELQVTLADPADSPAADDTVRALRTGLDAVSRDALVGGVTAQNVDLRDTATADRNRIIPVILAVIFVVLALLLRALVAPVLLIAANVLSFAATLGAAALVFNHVLDFPGSDPSVPLYGFVFLVALGIDYSIFLMTRVREEAGRQGTRPGILTGLAVTGGVITSAGIVLAATFAALGVVPILFLAQVAFIVAFGVLLDTLVVRSLLVPALAHDLGRWTWWPSRLARADPPPAS